MTAYDINRPIQSRINFFDRAGRTTNLFEFEPLNAFDSIEAIILQSEEPLEEYFWSKLQSVSLWRYYWTEATRNRGGHQIDNPVFKNFWTKYYGLHVNCQDQEESFANITGEEPTAQSEEPMMHNQIHKPRSDFNQRTKQ